MMRALAIVVALAAGCVSTDTTPCGGGARCLAGTECVAITFTDGLDTACVSHDQRKSCETSDDGEPCTIGTAMVPGTCHEHVCFPDACGNRLVDIAEACDDGNLVGGDGCSGTCASNETCGNREIDVVEGEGCDGGDWLSHDGCSSGCAVESPTWTRLENARPSARGQAQLVYDVGRRRVVVFGGGTNPYAVGDTSEWDGRRWSSPEVLPEPLPRLDHAMAYDVARGQIVMFGGSQAREFWLRDRDGTWSLKTPAVRPPNAGGASMVYDAGRQRVVMFGGYGNNMTSDATWIWDGATWSELTTQPRPPGRYDAAMAYDPKRGVVVMLGGSGFTPDVLDDLWELNGDTWVERPAAIQQQRNGAAMTYDPLSERVVVVGGVVDTSLDKQTWAWDGVTWTQLADAKVIAPDFGLFQHSMTTDAARGRMVLLGTHGDVQEWDGTQWTIVDQAQAPMPRLPPRTMHAAAVDPLRREVVVFGGTRPESNVVYGDTWIWNGVWRQVIGAPAPSPRWGASLTFDVARREMVLFGGCNVAGPFADTWVWSGGSWSQKLPTTSPPARCNHASAYDPGTGEIVVFSGLQGGTTLRDTWTWNGTTWTDRAPPVQPGGRFAHAMAYDPVRAEIVLFGGTNNVLFTDTWTWNGQVWKLLTPTSSPSPRIYSALAWDATRQRLVMFAGSSNAVASTDVWEWDGADWTLIPTLRPPVARNGLTLVSDLDGAGVLVIGGHQIMVSAGTSLDDVWRLAWADSGVYELCTEVDTDGDGKTGAIDADCWSMRTPLCPPGTSCDPLAPRCGDGVCNDALETCAVCPDDCDACAAGCGNFACDGGETMASCPGDCGA